MLTLLLIIIYVSFISLGLPDPILGSAWPVVSAELGVPLSYGGIASMLISAGTILSSYFSVRVIKRLGTGPVVAVSTAMTAAGLFGYSVSGSFLWLCLMAVPLGLGAGSIDAALNNFVALHYKSRHMSWLHCFWGVGATLGPIIMSQNLSQANSGWRGGYTAVAIIQTCLALALIISLPLWKKFTASEKTKENGEVRVLKLGELLRTHGALPTLISFFCYCAVEATCGLWTSSYLSIHEGYSSESAAFCAGLFFFGITAGRFISGFITFKLSNKMLIRLGLGVITAGVLAVLLPLPDFMTPAAFAVIGFGCAPIYPCIIHETPARFGKDVSQAFIGAQMAFAYLGTTLMPPLFGLIADYVAVWLFPVYLLVLTAVMIIASETVNRMMKRKT